MDRNRVLLPVIGGLLLAGVAIFLLLQDGASDGGVAPVAVLQGDAANSPAGGSAASGVPLVERAAQPDALPASIAPAVVDADLDPNALPESYRRALGVLTGRIVEAEGAPVAGMTIELVGGRKSLVMLPRDALLNPGALDINPIVASAVSGADGRFRMEDIEPRTFGGLILDPGGPRALLHMLEISPASGLEQDLGDITLPATATLKGRLVDERGAALAGVRVRATELPMAGIPGMDAVVGAVADFRSGGAVLVPAGTEGVENDVIFAPPASLMRLEKHLPLPTTITDGTGAFVLSGVTPGIVLLAADDGIHLPLVKDSIPTGAAGGERDLGTLVMGDGSTLRGRVMDDKGEPVVGAQILAGNSLGIVPIALLKGPVRSDAEGRFQVKGLRDGVVWLAARTDRRQEHSAFSTESLAREFVITLPAPRTLRVTVLDEQAKPVAGARFLGRVIEENDIPDFLLPPRPLDEQVRIDAEEPGTYVLTDLQPGLWELVVKAPGFGIRREQMDLTSGDRNLELRLVAGRTLFVSVVREGDGAPVEHAFVEVFQDSDEMPDTAARTDAAGFARLEGLLPGEVNLMVTHPALAIGEEQAQLPAEAGGEPVQVVVELMSGGSILGSVIENGGPPHEPLMVVMDPRGGRGDAQIPRMTLTDMDGNFRFDQVEEGTANLEARTRNDLKSGVMLFEAFFNSPLAEENVEVAAGGESRVTLVVGAGLEDVDTGYLSGQLTVNGRAAENWKVRSFGRIRRTAVVDSSGRFDLGRVEAGEVTLACSAPGSSLMEGATETIEVPLEKDEHKLVNLSFSTGAVRGRVVSAQDGRGLPGVRLRAVAEGELRGWYRQSGTVSGADGSFSIDTIAAGTYRLSGSLDGFANSSTEPFEVTELREVSNVELRLSKSLRVEGVISVVGTDEKPGWMWLVASSTTGNSRDTAQVDRKTGKFTLDGLAPGQWTLTLATDLDNDLAPITMSFDRDVTGVALAFSLAPDDGLEVGEQVIKVTNY